MSVFISIVILNLSEAANSSKVLTVGSSLGTAMLAV